MNKTLENLDKYKGKLRKSRTAIRRGKRMFENKLVANVKSDSKSFYAYVRSKQRTTDRVGPLVDNAGNVISDDFETANALNNFLAWCVYKRGV